MRKKEHKLKLSPGHKYKVFILFKQTASVQSPLKCSITLKNKKKKNLKIKQLER